MEPDRIDKAKVRNAWAAAGYTCELWVGAPHQVWHDFRHEIDERILMLDGRVLVEMQGRTILLQPGDELQIPAGIRHTVRNGSPEPVRWLYGYRTSSDAADAKATAEHATSQVTSSKHSTG